MKSVRDLFEICEKHPTKNIAVMLAKTIYPIYNQYIEDSVLYLFLKNEDYDEQQYNGEGMAWFIEYEGHDSCWFDWRKGSKFLDCELCFVPHPSEEYEQCGPQNCHDIVDIKITNENILLICKE